MTRANWTKSTSTTSSCSGSSHRTRSRRCAGSVSMPAVDDLGEPVELAPRLPRVRLEARQLEQRADAVVEARDVAHDGAQLVAHALLVPVDVALEQVAHRRGERGERRLELVRDGREQARLEVVRLPGRRGCRRGALQPLALQERADHVAERGHQPRVSGASRGGRRRRACTVRTPDTPDGLRTGTYRPPSPGSSADRRCRSRRRGRRRRRAPSSTARPPPRRARPGSYELARLFQEQRRRGRPRAPRRSRRGSSRPSAPVDVCETTAALRRLSAAVSCSRARARASRSRMRPASAPTITPTTRNATSESQSLGSWISSVWYGGRKKKFHAKNARTAARTAGPGAGGARHQQDDQQVQQRPLALGEGAAAGEEQRGAHGDRHHGEHVAVTRECLRDRVRSCRPW